LPKKEGRLTLIPAEAAAEPEAVADSKPKGKRKKESVAVEA
jgi:hypothetical protein